MIRLGRLLCLGLIGFFALSSTQAFAQKNKKQKNNTQKTTVERGGCNYEVVAGLAEIIRVKRVITADKSLLKHDEYEIAFKFIPMDGGSIIPSLQEEEYKFQLKSKHAKINVGPKYLEEYHVNVGTKFAMKMLQNRANDCGNMDKRLLFESGGLPNDLSESRDNIAEYEQQILRKKVRDAENGILDDEGTDYENKLNNTVNPHEFASAENTTTTEKDPITDENPHTDNPEPQDNKNENPMANTSNPHTDHPANRHPENHSTNTTTENNNPDIDNTAMALEPDFRLENEELVIAQMEKEILAQLKQEEAERLEKERLEKEKQQAEAAKEALRKAREEARLQKQKEKELEEKRKLDEAEYNRKKELRENELRREIEARLRQEMAEEREKQKALDAANEAATKEKTDEELAEQARKQVAEEERKNEEDRKRQEAEKQRALADLQQNELERSDCVFGKKVSGTIRIVDAQKVKTAEASIFGYAEYQLTVNFKPDYYDQLSKKEQKVWDDATYEFVIDPTGKAANPSARYVKEFGTFPNVIYKGFYQKKESGICVDAMIFATDLPIDYSQIR